MKCPNCQAKLMPVDGELFCLQCGTVVHSKPDAESLIIEETTDPVLREAIVDAVHHDVAFQDKREVIESKVVPKTPIALKPRSGMVPIVVAKSPALPAPVMKMAIATATSSIGSQNVGSVMPRVGSDAGAKVKSRIDDIFSESSPKSAFAKIRYGGMVGVWLGGIAAFALFVGINFGISSYFTNRVYPGVTVGNVSLGGMSFNDARIRIDQLIGPGQLTITTNSGIWSVNTAAYGAPSEAQVDQQVEAVGHSASFGLQALVEGIVSRNVSDQMSTVQLQRLATEVSTLSARQVLNAVSVIVDGHAVSLPSHPGAAIDLSKVTQALSTAMRRGENVITLTPTVIEPSVVPEALAAQILAANTALAANVSISVAGKTFSPTLQNKADWISFTPAGNSITANTVAIDSYVNSIQGKFDRIAVAQALSAAFMAGHSQNVVANTGVITTLPVSNMSGASAGVKVTYCTPNLTDPAVLSGVVKADLASTTPWTLGGAIGYNAVQSDCNVGITLVPDSQMAQLSQECAGKILCVSGNTISIDEEAWNATTATLTSREELVDQGVGAWLGYPTTTCANNGIGTMAEGISSVMPQCIPK